MIPWGIVSTARVYSNASVWATENRISFPNGSDQERSLDLKEASCQLPPSISQLDMFKGENFYTGQRVYSSTDDDVIGWPAEIRASSDLPPRNRLISERKSPPPNTEFRAEISSQPRFGGISPRSAFSELAPVWDWERAQGLPQNPF